MSILSRLNLHPCLRARVRRIHRPPPPPNANPSGDASTPTAELDGRCDGFVLYLPTVCLRREQNPAFAVACHAANFLRVPLVVLAVVLDDSSHASAAYPHRLPLANSADSPSTSVVMTSRRLAFVLQALSEACDLWSAHGAAVGARIHSGEVGGARTPDHLTLASRAAFVVTDEPFVSPFATLARRVEGACARAGVECVRVDGSCTVPPAQVLTRRASASDNDGCKVLYDGVPAKAYQWQKKTEHLREAHLTAAIEGRFDAPELLVKMEDEDLFLPVAKRQEEGRSASGSADGVAAIGWQLAHLFPSRWKPRPLGDEDVDGPSLLPSAPDVRPFTSCELSQLYENAEFELGGAAQENDDGGKHQRFVQDTKKPGNFHPFHNFALSWPGADPSVPPCPQTIGTTTRGMQRWNDFVRSGLTRYGKERNDARLVHSVSRMSAYLNLGVVSIFRLVWEVKRAQGQHRQKGSCVGQPTASTGRLNKWNKSGPDKFEEEIVKFREMSYAHAFSREDYDGVGSLPRWSISCLNDHPNRSQYTMEQLAEGRTGNAKWDAMQQYLVRTGELHNNVRMTWGKNVVEWAGCCDSASCISPAQSTLRTLCYLNDRYALDGLSPPSYAGLLWCIGWTDKPTAGGGGGWTIGRKPAHRYRMNQEDFRLAERKLLEETSVGDGCASGSGGDSGRMRRQRSVLDMMKLQSTSSTSEPITTANHHDQDVKSEVKSNSSTGEDSTESPTSRGVKRNGTCTIDRFFSKTPKKGALNVCKQVVG